MPTIVLGSPWPDQPMAQWSRDMMEYRRWLAEMRAKERQARRQQSMQMVNLLTNTATNWMQLSQRAQEAKADQMYQQATIAQRREEAQLQAQQPFVRAQAELQLQKVLQQQAEEQQLQQSTLAELESGQYRDAGLQHSWIETTNYEQDLSEADFGDDIKASEIESLNQHRQDLLNRAMTLNRKMPKPPSVEQQRLAADTRQKAITGFTQDEALTQLGVVFIPNRDGSYDAVRREQPKAATAKPAKPDYTKPELVKMLTEEQQALAGLRTDKEAPLPTLEEAEASLGAKLDRVENMRHKQELAELSRPSAKDDPEKVARAEEEIENFKRKYPKETGGIGAMTDEDYAAFIRLLEVHLPEYAEQAKAARRQATIERYGDYWR